MTSEEFQHRMAALYKRIDRLVADKDGVVRHSATLIMLNRRVRETRRIFRDETRRMARGK